MPITRRQFELEIDPQIEEWMRRVHRLLAEHRDEAFTEQELREQYATAAAELLSDSEKNMLDSATTRDRHVNAFDISERLRRDFNLALEKLVELTTVSKARIADEDYYAYRSDLDTVL